MWGSFMMSLYLMMISIATILHKRWSVHERLVYPLVQLPLDMLTEERGSVLNSFLRSPLMWFRLRHSLRLAHGWASDIRTAVMTSTANALKLASSTSTRPRYLFWVIIIAALVALVGSACTVIAIAYTHGGINLHGWFYGTMNRRAFEHLAVKQLNPIPDWDILGPRGLFAALGAGIMGLLMYSRHRFINWPLHYIGFPIGGTYVMFFAWSSMFLGWSSSSSY